MSNASGKIDCRDWPQYLWGKAKHEPEQGVLDSVWLRNLKSSGIGAESSKTETFSKEEERQLWDAGMLGTDNPLSLLCAVFFNNGNICWNWEIFQCLAIAYFRC